MPRLTIPFLFILLSGILLGCSASGRGNAPRLGLSDIKIKKSVMVDFKKIKTSDNRVIGYLEETENIVTSPYTAAGEESIKIFYVYDKGFNKVGFMTGLGTVSVYQYTAEGLASRVTEGKVYTIDEGNRQLLSYEGIIYYEDFEPDPLWREK
ncbi:MAG: hypothetical protein AB1599_03300 [Planctomycetota bacterium]